MQWILHYGTWECEFWWDWLGRRQDRLEYVIILNANVDSYTIWTLFLYDYTIITDLMHCLLFIRKILLTLLYMFRESSTHLQEDIVVYKQHMVPSLSIRVLVSCWYAATGSSSPYSCVSTGHQDSYREWRYHMLLVYNYVLLKMSTWFSKHVEESNILRINNRQRIKLVIIV